METIISFFKRRWWSFAPLLVCLCVWFLSYYTKTPKGSYQGWIGANGQNDIVNDPIILFLFFFTPSTFALFFVRKQVVQAWSLFALVYVFAGVMYVIKQNVHIGVFGSSTSFFPLFAGFFLSAITIFWAIIHTLIIRRREKKVNQAVVK